jgi:hypothetical protein
MDDETKRYKVHGTVTGRESRPLSEARVVVWWQHIRKRRRLGVGKTSKDGRYHIRYRVPEKAPQPVLIVVEASSEDLDHKLVSPLTQVQPDLEIDLRYEPYDQSEWATLVRSIEPLPEGLKLSELVEDGTHHDITFLARELGKWSIPRIAMNVPMRSSRGYRFRFTQSPVLCG